MRFLSLLVLAFLGVRSILEANALVYKTYDAPFPECTANASVCDDSTHYPHCVQCSPELSLCSAKTSGCGCKIPDHMNRGNNQGSYLDNGEQFYTRIHCSEATTTGSDHRVRNVYRCQNAELVLLQGFFVPCFEPNTTCIDTGLEGQIGGPLCVGNSGSLGKGLAATLGAPLLVTAIGVIMLLF